MIYDHEANIICLEVAKGKIHNAKEFGNFIIHISKAGKPILIEILDGSKFIGQMDKVKKIKKFSEEIATAS
ncbi:hypothetical protein CO115_04765 [Candidatus Falkowbacteria bacterium CG_4_9_14_3_um_filter_36_9]|uniref:DUF2283 domain-containing protein n=1 Tax=Candidatus Falkowbacteria bacterium CG02_land_8_20_14_3_00_36_14 TaxID=1974560 RepID=A0A2M7DME7_9BACT|nr:MAG: hypothetical protein COS18_03620 [Candidatus Falkowbacteria bacterium CG02_land_8_20_14_3_00_36_14]PIX12223.1 MAG: hypothetical protein COZ73_00685 [Candidatus Falkowbacteria bacterium CG_4_8_14_3_um_filter_36_11]PJA10676.1 MAG: hypothetical protein COX67_03775 [Candidatus Falkowbacteria bacterium CG_4_10_14_0_2_um_filter_36_22]PJB18347.1 MAG: hypothetical protein CO115_04765 [Candidatus Falkowbacteria bacterium CG_4_9_14_3_um_filter_36_9]